MYIKNKYDVFAILSGIISIVLVPLVVQILIYFNVNEEIMAAAVYFIIVIGLLAFCFFSFKSIKITDKSPEDDDLPIPKKTSLILGIIMMGGVACWMLFNAISSIIEYLFH